MKKFQISQIMLVSLLVLVLLCLGACTQGDNPADTAEVPTTIETVGSSDPAETTGETETVAEEEKDVVAFPNPALIDYSKYINANRIKEVLGSQRTLAFSVGGDHYYNNGVLSSGGANVLTRDADGNLVIAPQEMGALVDREGLAGTTLDAMAQELGMKYSVYDKKMVIFYEKTEPLHGYSDLYTLEAMHLYLTSADEVEIVNAMITLPDRVSNDVNNTIFYTNSELNLGIQTSIYYAQMGNYNNGITPAPALVAGEGKHKDNFTTVRIYNNQNSCTTQFLAFDPSVKGGVQVAAAKVGENVLIATAPFAEHDGKNGDIRVYDTSGLICMTIKVRDVIAGPLTIVTGHFAEGIADEVLLVASQTTNDKGELTYAIISLADGHIISQHTLDCSFALGEAKTGVAVQLSLRENTMAPDSVIVYFNSVQAVYEGNAQKAEFTKAEITLPADATGVSASNLFGEKYVVALPAREGQENQSFVTVYKENAAEGLLMDVGFRENRFFAQTMPAGQNDDRYVCQAPFYHSRVDEANTVYYSLGGALSNDEIDEIIKNAPYHAFNPTSITNRFVEELPIKYMMLEPCFTHRWHMTFTFENLVKYTDKNGDHIFSAITKEGTLSYAEGDTFYNGSYADGVLDASKMRIFPLRHALQATAVAFRGAENSNPEHLVGMSPVHEQEITVEGSVGDYNPYMIEGFRIYLMERYGSVENINAIFETNFEDYDSIDAPRDGAAGDRGKWDLYGDKRGKAYAYTQEWMLYNRSIVSKRIMEAYREALLAGFPPESITAHSIPEGEAVGGLINAINSRLTPIDVILSCGTGYGGTRYGIGSVKDNICYNASLMGHWNITLGEYSALTADKEDAYSQLKTLWGQGLRYVHQLASDNYLVAEEYAINKLYEENLPRPGYTGGTTNAMSVKNGNDEYNIVQIGSGDKNGLLKSIDANGKWEGTVYLVPFHAAMDVKALDSLATPVDGTANVFATGELGRMKNADQVEITFAAAKVGEADAWVTFEVYKSGCLVEASVTTYQLTETMTSYRYVLAQQMYDTDLEIKVTFHTEAGDGSMENIKVENLQGTLQTEKAGYKYYDNKKANAISEAHEGGVTFDLLDRDLKG